MKRARFLAWALIPLLVGIPGCDVAVGVYFATRKSSSHSSAALAPAIDTTFSVWVANLSAGTNSDSQVKTNIQNNGGQPTGEWTRVGGFTRSTDVDLSVLQPGTWDSILIGATANEKYLLDAVVILNASGDPIASFSSTQNDRMLTPVQANGLPDGITSETDAIAGQSAFIFQRFIAPVAPLTRFRVEAWDKVGGPSSGDTAWRATIAAPGEQRSGGMDVVVSSPVDHLYISLRNVVSSTVDVIEVDELGPNGSLTQNVALQSNVTGKVGAPSLAVASNGDIFVAHSVGAADLRVRRFNSSLSSTVWNQPITNSGTTAARVEPNSLALDGSDNAILAGGYDFGVANGGFGHYMQRLRASDGALWGTPPLPPVDVNDTYWRGVVTSGVDDIFATGDLLGSLPSTSLDIFTRKTSQSSTGAETWRALVNGADNLADCGNAVGVDAGGNIYVGGFVTSSGQGKNAILLKLDPTGAVAGSPWPFMFNGSGNGDDEILGLVVEGTTVYATGYETTSTQGKNLFVVKIDVSGAPTVLWKRPYHGGFGDDRGVSLKTTATHVFVSGDVDQGGGDFDIFIWKLLK
jgi:hypothetical protein